MPGAFICGLCGEKLADIPLPAVDTAEDLMLDQLLEEPDYELGGPEGSEDEDLLEFLPGSDDDSESEDLAAIMEEVDTHMDDLVAEFEGEFKEVPPPEMDDQEEDVEQELHVCDFCGFVTKNAPPDNCPICTAPKQRFKKVGEE